KGPIRRGKYSPPLSHPTYVPSVPAWKRKPTQNEAEARQRSWRPILPVGTDFLRQKASRRNPGGAREKNKRQLTRFSTHLHLLPLLGPLCPSKGCVWRRPLRVASDNAPCGNVALHLWRGPNLEDRSRSRY